jgi:death-on-curing protein
MTEFSIGKPRFVSIDEANEFHQALILQFGGSLGVRDVGALDSAMAMPRQSFGGEFAHTFPFGMAAAYAFHLAKNHPFVDGNKRIALMCCISFLRMNGWSLLSGGVEAADRVLDLLAGTLDKPGLAQWLEENSKARPSYELRDFFAMVTGPALREAMTSSVAVPAGPEFDASLHEAGQHMTLVRDIRVEAGLAVLQGHKDRLERCGVELALLMHLYRLAEDHGYEW